MRALALSVALAFVPMVETAGAQDIFQLCSDISSPRQAIDACTRLINSDNLNSKGLSLAYNNRGSSYFMLREYTKALSELDTAAYLDQSNAGARYNIGLLFSEIGQLRVDHNESQDSVIIWIAALNNFEAAMRTDPSLSEAQEHRDYIRQLLGKLDPRWRDKEYLPSLRPIPQVPASKTPSDAAATEQAEIDRQNRLRQRGGLMVGPLNPSYVKP
jgi:tetratricopeptide (TPR) repeat protein